MKAGHLIAFAGLLAACASTTRHSRTPSAEEIKELDQSLRGDSGTIRLEGEALPRPARDLAFGTDGVFWRDPQGKGWRVRYDGVQDVSTRSHGLGLAQGLGWGALGGAVIGAAIGAGAGSDHCPSPGGEYVCFTRAGGAAVGGILLGLAGGAVGAILGALHGAEHTDEFR